MASMTRPMETPPFREGGTYQPADPLQETPPLARGRGCGPGDEGGHDADNPLARGGCGADCQRCGARIPVNNYGTGRVGEAMSTKLVVIEAHPWGFKNGDRLCPRIRHARNGDGDDGIGED